ncbi:VIT1/CCC1 transporter family protein [Tepidibacillus sp. HK-1]|uniref:VIT1/CCC1 transporter family protein n=1 Tax=Tepidibacillus sp. HK-1 TaxID=1883407 RepID=UPI000853DA02|nr:VIT1/CCC1 transporter family protein [Tepidibacillus sp. HK-1]GBF11354.1 VIT family protein [Tepidibacillus sp. HK-1]
MLSRNLDKAREAYKSNNKEASKIVHQQRKHAPEGHNQEQGQYIKSFIYGGLDGIITTFAVVAGVAGAQLSSGIVLIMGFANLIADGLSMAIGDYLSTKAENEFKQSERERELWEVENFPEGEKQELIELYVAKGMDESDAKVVTEIISKNKEAWVDIMMVEELGILEENESPVKNAIVTFISFSVFGFIPLVIYVVAGFTPGIQNFTFLIAIILTGFTLFILGALKVKFVDKHWFASGLEMLIVGGIAAASAYGIGILLSGLA